jgi:hypothetical protein
VEVLVSVVFMAIVIPVALGAMRVATLAGETAQRRLVAARVANKVLNDLRVENFLQNGGGQRGVVQENGVTYTWTEKNSLWSLDPASRMTLATVSVAYNVAGHPCKVELSTLSPPPQNQFNANGIY